MPRRLVPLSVRMVMAVSSRHPLIDAQQVDRSVRKVQFVTVKYLSMTDR